MNRYKLSDRLLETNMEHDRRDMTLLVSAWVWVEPGKGRL